MKQLAEYWDDIPVGKAKAYTYTDLCFLWNCNSRKARAILHELSLYDSGDDYILIRSSGCRGFYKTDNAAEIRAYKRECLNRGRNVFAPIKKINRVLNADAEQYSIENNLRVVRKGCGLSQTDVCRYMQQYDRAFNKPLLSKMENGVCLPTYYQLQKLAVLMGCKPSELVRGDLY